MKGKKLDAPLQARTRAAAKCDLANSVTHALIATACDEEPICHRDAFSNELCLNAMQAELNSIHVKDAWELCDLPVGEHVVGTKWLYKVKRKANGSVDRYKARLMAKVYALKDGIDFEKTIVPTSCITTIWCILALAAHNHCEVY